MIYEILFSATGRSEKVLNIISSRWEEEKIRIDLSKADFNRSEYNFTSSDLCIFCTSVYGGRIPVPVADRMKKLQGNGAKAILTAVFGNRAVDDCLFEMRDVTQQAGFVPVAAVESSVQHSIITKVEPDRPDAEDKKELAEFAAKIKAALEQKDRFAPLEVPGNKPYLEMGGIPLKPKANGKCISCGLCAQKCPVQAIPLDNPKITDKEKCINCMRCAKICPVDARDFPAVLIAAAHMAMKSKFAGRKPNKLYIAE